VIQRIGGVFVIADTNDANATISLISKAMESVPSGRCLFVLWKVGDFWGRSLPVETISVKTILGAPENRNDNGWAFYGNGSVRLYKLLHQTPESTWMWVGFRREGEKAYRRKTNGDVSSQVIAESAIPVSDKVFTRDVANNLWHLNSENGKERIISRLQALTTWSDEIVVILHGTTKKIVRYKGLDCSGDLVPVSEKYQYECDGIELSQSGKIRVKQKEKLF
jgi:hypothetical protein